MRPITLDRTAQQPFKYMTMSKRKGFSANAVGVMICTFGAAPSATRLAVEAVLLVQAVECNSVKVATATPRIIPVEVVRVPESTIVQDVMVRVSLIANVVVAKAVCRATSVDRLMRWCALRSFSYCCKLKNLPFSP